ncbi:sodium:proton antiporter [uncultured Methanomethylovorans sp.]|uniref:sodium:proton antiporter n=1 Tax=uncultured Methanomethylovorans sp. TaxID=183759 RepID=UPI002AA72DC2|nr:sodium:proton antiporter [uncultured Methanomethylovorans sp.]
MESVPDKEKVILENLKYLNDSVIAILLLMPVTLVIAFEALDSTESLKWLSIATWLVYIFGLWYVASRVFRLNNRILEHLKE